MERRAPYLVALAALWLTIPLTALHFWRAWDHLPMQLATHFDANWHPNGWSPRDDAVRLVFMILGFTLLLLTPACALVRARKPGHSWPVLVISFFVVGFMFYVVNQLVSRNALPG